MCAKKVSGETSKPDLGDNLKRLRGIRGWSVSRLANEADIPQSTLSKVENGQMSLNYEKLIQVAQALEVDVSDLFVTDEELSASQSAMARRTIDRHSESYTGREHHFNFRYLCTELKNRLMVPALLDIEDLNAVNIDSDTNQIPMMKILGERFAYVLEGPVLFHCEQYETVRLETGDALYIDAAMPHSFTSESGQHPKVLTVLSSSDFDYLRVVREAATAGDADASERFARLKAENNERA